MSTTSAAHLAEVAGRRGRSYWLLARGFSEPPSRTLFGDLITALGPVSLAEPLAAETVAFADAVQAALGNDEYSEALAIEYTRLFGGLSASYGAMPPFESVAREGNWGGDTVVAVVAAYAEANVVPPLHEASPQDHIGAELRFLAIACHRESEAWRAGDTGTAMEWVRRERDFLDQHLLCWIPEYCRKVADMAEAPFYRALLALTPRACELDREDVDTILETVPSFAANV